MVNHRVDYNEREVIKPSERYTTGVCQRFESQDCFTADLHLYGCEKRCPKQHTRLKAIPASPPADHHTYSKWQIQR